MKKVTLLAAALAALSLLAGCGSSGTDTQTGATETVLPLAEDVCVRAGTEPDGELLLDTESMEGFIASKDYSDEQPYGFALVLTNDGKDSFRNATRKLAKEQSAITLWAGDEAVCSPVITQMLNTNFVILSIASVTDDESYAYVVDLLSED